MHKRDVPSVHEAVFNKKWPNWLRTKEKWPTNDKYNNNTMEEFRRKANELILASLVGDDVCELARQLECVAFDQDETLGITYRLCVRKILTHIKRDAFLRNCLIDGSTSPQSFLDSIINPSIMQVDDTHVYDMTNQDVTTKSEPTDEYDIVALRSNTNATIECARQSQQGMFACGKCGSEDCTFVEMQTRSADEGMTAFISCKSCGNKWKL
jgi:DNA-directed RNA polymerase subunit M/transcription elongation factor TFIIS